MKYQVKLLLVLLLIFLCILACNHGEVDYPYPIPISFSGFVPGVPDVFVSFMHNDHFTFPKIVQLGLGSGETRISYFSTADAIYTDGQSTLFDSFAINFYSSDITNAPGWDKYNQDTFEITNMGHLVYFSTNYTNTRTLPELFNPGNSLPFYLSTNSGHVITIKGFQTNK